MRHIGNELGVSLVLEGSVRKSGSIVRITVQLIQTSNGFHLWSENFDRKLANIFELQDEISLLVADKIRENYGHLELNDQLIHMPIRDVDTYDNYLRAVHYLNKFNTNDIRQGISILEEVVKTEPNFALAHINIHYGHNSLAAGGLMPAQEALSAGLHHLQLAYKIDANLPEYYHSMGWHSLNMDWDFKQANVHLFKALELNPGYADAHQKLFINLALDGHLDQAKHHIDKARELDPLAVLNNYFTAYYYYLVSDFRQSNDYFDRTFKLDSSFLVGYSIFALLQVSEGNAEAILALKQKMPEMEGGVEEGLIMETFASIIKNESDLIAKNVNQLKTYLNGNSRERVRFFLVYIELMSDKLASAFALIDEGIRHKEPLLTLLKVDPLLKKYHQIEGFKSRLDQIFKRSDKHLSYTPKNKKSTKLALSEEEIDEVLARLEELIQKERTFLDSTLSLRQLAEMASIHPNKLSFILNESLGKNFNDFINGFRLEEFQRIAMLSENKHLTLLGLAYESGFNSKSVFNDFFKKKTGKTPKQWLKDQ